MKHGVIFPTSFVFYQEFGEKGSSRQVWSGPHLQGFSPLELHFGHLRSHLMWHVRDGVLQGWLDQQNSMLQHACKYVVRYSPPLQSAPWTTHLLCATPVVWQAVVLDHFNVCSNHAPLNYNGQESKYNLQFMILIFLWPWNKVKVIKPGMNC